MKVETTISQTPELLHELDRILANNGHGSLSELIEEALRSFLLQREQAVRGSDDLELINRNAVRLNQEAKDVLTYQVEW